MKKFKTDYYYNVLLVYSIRITYIINSIVNVVAWWAGIRIRAVWVIAIYPCMDKIKVGLFQTICQMTHDIIFLAVE